VRGREVLARALLRPGVPGARPGRRPRATVLLLAAFALSAGLLSLGAVPGDPSLVVPTTSPPTADRGSQAPAADEADSPRLPADTVAAWTRNRLPEGYAAAIAASDELASTTLVRSGTYRLVRTEDVDGTVVDELPEGWAYPVELVALDPATYDEVADQAVVSPLAPDEALLSASSAAVRGIGEGAMLGFADGTELRVAAVVPDELVGAGEVVVRTDGPLVPERERYVLVRPGAELADRDEVEAHLAGLLPEERALGTVALGEEPVLRNSAGVLAPARMKVHFGEFAMREAAGRAVLTGFSWIEEHITVEEVPILGRVECHREMFEPLRAALQELVDRGLEHTVDRRDYGGCWVARTQGGIEGPLSSHAWGTSIDFNVSDNHLGAEPSQDPRLVEVMAEHGFTWGGDWLLPDAMHFELVPDRDPS
jgi:hypothetical protein